MKFINNNKCFCFKVINYIVLSLNRRPSVDHFGTIQLKNIFPIFKFDNSLASEYSK